MPYREPTYDEAVAAARRVLGSALKRAGTQNGKPRFNGPCPICGGRDRFRVAQGDRKVLIPCSHGCSFKELLDALGLSDDSDGLAPEPRIGNAPAMVPARNGWLENVWTATIAADDTPGASYLVDHRNVWLAGRRLPPPVRWLPAVDAKDLGVRRNDWPEAAKGCLVYLFAAPGEAEVWALKIEAIADDGRALPFGSAERSIKRPSLSGSLTDGGRRTFRAGGDSDRGIHLVEGPIDALALLTLEALEIYDLRGAAVLGADGIGGFTERACVGTGPVWLYPDGARWDEKRNAWVPEAEAKAARLADALERVGRGRVRLTRQLFEQDLADMARDLVLERDSLQADD